MFDSLPNSENGRFGRFGRPAEPFAPKGRRFGRLWRDSRFHLQYSESEGTLLALLRNGQLYSLLLSMRVVFVFFNWKPRLHQGKSETSAFLKNLVFDWEMCFHLCEVYRFQNLVGLELPIKHTLYDVLFQKLHCSILSTGTTRT